MQPIGSEPDQSKYQQPELSPALKDRKVRRRFWDRASAYVTEGYFICRRLRYTSQYREIPDYSSAITSLAMGPGGEEGREGRMRAAMSRSDSSVFMIHLRW